jgi:hypothetical protein
MKAYMYMLICSDNPEPDLAFFEDKQDCLDYLNSEVDRYCKEYHMFREEFDVGMDSWHTDNGDYEFTFILREINIKEKKK